MPLAMPMGRFLWDVDPIAERVQGLGSCVLYAAVRRVLLTYLLLASLACVLVVGISWFVFFTSLDHYGLSFPAFTRSGVRIRRNLCIREGVRIRTRCVYALPLA